MLEQLLNSVEKGIVSKNVACVIATRILKNSTLEEAYKIAEISEKINMYKNPKVVTLKKFGSLDEVLKVKNELNKELTLRDYRNLIDMDPEFESAFKYLSKDYIVESDRMNQWAAVYAAKMGNGDLLAYFLQHGTINNMGEIMFYTESTRIMTYLLELGFDPNSTHRDQRIIDLRPDMAELLVKYGANK